MPAVGATVRALWGSSHPGPMLVVTALAAALGVAAGLEPWRVVFLTAAVFATQFSIGLSNDAVDAERDRAVGRTDKPVARGELSARGAMTAATIAVVIGMLLSVPLGPGMLAGHAVMVAAGWAYNVRLKSTAFSLVPFIVAFGVFPTLATLAAVPPVVAAPWAWIAGAALGAAVHLTNVLPDLDDDARTGVRGLPHRLGGRSSAVLATGGVIVGAVAVLLGPVGADVGAVAPVSWVFFTAVVVVAVAALLRATLRPPGRAVFRLVMLASLLLAAQLVATGRALAG